ncbi:MAG TPA: carboxypeptidase regulatory-like domain-containing protein [Thermoanaerobaculia bacterium]|jgi:plastocyanin
MRHRGAFLLVLLASLALATAAFAGTLTGTITYDDKVPPPGAGPFKPIQMDADPACKAKHEGPVPLGELVLGSGNTLGNVFVQVKSPPAGNHTPPATPVQIDQNGCVYHPHVAGVLVGQALLFKNSDGILHNVHGLPKQNQQFNIGMPPTLKEKAVTLGKPEPLFTVKCDVHPWMNAYVAVMSHPYFAVTGEDGKFSIDGLPDGTYEVEAWHEKLGTQTVSVKAGEPAKVSFKIPGK